MLYDRKLYTPQNTAMKALIIYDDLACAVNTNATLHRAAHEADVMLKWDISPWPVNMLEFSPTAEQALSDATEAHLIVLAIRHTLSLPIWLMNWLERWDALRHVLDPALAVVGDRDANSPTATATVDVSRFSRQFGLCFIRHDFGEVDDDLRILDPASTECKASGLRVPPYFDTLSNDNADRVWASTIEPSTKT
jgi:hypothetical protein